LLDSHRLYDKCSSCTSRLIHLPLTSLELYTKQAQQLKWANCCCAHSLHTFACCTAQQWTITSGRCQQPSQPVMKPSVRPAKGLPRRPPSLCQNPLQWPQQIPSQVGLLYILLLTAEPLAGRPFPTFNDQESAGPKDIWKAFPCMSTTPCFQACSPGTHAMILTQG
jgi:hypothetical protein